jgi:hypothetical protein
VHLERIDHLVERRSLAFAAALVGLLAARVIDEHAAHRLRRHAEEVRAALPRLAAVAADQPHPGLVHERRRLQRVSRRSPAHVGACERAQLVVDERQQLLRSGRVARVHALQEDSGLAGDFHGSLRG